MRDGERRRSKPRQTPYEPFLSIHFVLPLDYDMKTNAEILKARMEGATAVLEGRKLDANTYDETDDLHFEWLAGWASARMEMQKRRGQNASDQIREPKTSI